MPPRRAGRRATKRPTQATDRQGCLVFCGIAGVILGLTLLAYWFGPDMVDLLKPVVAGSSVRGFSIGVASWLVPLGVGIGFVFLFGHDDNRFRPGCWIGGAITLLLSVPWLVLMPPRRGRGSLMTREVARDLPGAQTGAIAPVLLLLAGFFVLIIVSGINQWWKRRR